MKALKVNLAHLSTTSFSALFTVIVALVGAGCCVLLLGASTETLITEP